MTMLYFLIPALVWCVIARFRFHHHFSWKEAAAQAALTLVVLGSVFLVSDRMQTGSTQILNGQVTEMRPVRKSCPAGWVTSPSSHCTNYSTRSVKVGETCSTDSKGYRTCTDIMQTEYSYHFPWERRYYVVSDIPETFEIRRVDRQGAQTPPRFAEVAKGDPVAVERFYTNYIKAASRSLFQAAEGEPLELAYPKVADYYRANRVIHVGAAPDADLLARWNKSLAAVNRDLRPSGANVIIVVTDEGEDFSERLARSWHAHNINDVVLAIGVGSGEEADKILWADVRSWSRESLVNVVLEDAVREIGRLDPEAIDAAVRTAVSGNYRLGRMEDFEYLRHDIEVPRATMIIAFLILLVFTPGLTFLFVRHVRW